MSSVRGLKARPQTAIVLPARPPRWASIRGSRIAFWRSLAASTASTTRSSTPDSSRRADQRLARPWGSTSRRSRRRGTGTTSRCARRCPSRAAPGARRRPTRSHRFAISFMNEMRVASMALAAYLVSSAEAWSMTRIGLPGAHEGLVQLPHDRFDLGVVGADHHAVGLQEVVDRRALLEELGVRDDGEGLAGDARHDLCARARPCPRAPWTCRRRSCSRSWPARSPRPRPGQWLRSAAPSSSWGVPTAMKTISLARDRRVQVGGEAQPLLGRRCGGSSPRAPARRSGSLPAAGRSTFVAVVVDADARCCRSRPGRLPPPGRRTPCR